MFTGIITDIGKVVLLEQKGDLYARIATSYDSGTIDIGASIACDGICLTVITVGKADDYHWFDVAISAETVHKTTIGLGHNQWVFGRRLNLERALKLGDELGGHIVSGHVDGVAEVIECRHEGDSLRLMFSAPDDLAKFIAPKGSVVLNGTSLTVNEVSKNRFGVNVIPHTQQVTTWGQVAVGDRVNLEIDMLARYLARLQEYDRE